MTTPRTALAIVSILATLHVHAQRAKPYMSTNKPALPASHWLAVTGKPLAATAGAMTFQNGGQPERSGTGKVADGAVPTQVVPGPRTRERRAGREHGAGRREQPHATTGSRCRSGTWSARGPGAGRDVPAGRPGHDVAQARRGRAAGIGAGEVAQRCDLRRVRPLLQRRYPPRAGARH